MQKIPPIIEKEPRFDHFSDPFNPSIFADDYQKLTELKLSLEKFDTLQIISTISGLQLYPINQTHIIRLEVAARVAASCSSDGIKKIDRKRLKQILNRLIPINSCFGRNEDPPEYPFTLNIQFYGGNYVVYSGAYPIECFIVQTLLEVIDFNRESVPKEFFNHVYSAAKGILNISNQIAARNHHIRYLTSKNDQGNPIRIPPNELYYSLSNSLIFTEEEIEELAISQEFIAESIIQFSLPNGHEAFSNSIPQKNPLLHFPIIKTNSRYVVAAPTSLMATLRKFIIYSAEKFECKDILLNEYNSRIISVNRHWLSELGHTPINLKLPQWENQQNIAEWSSKIDNDKMAHIFLIHQENFEISGQDFYEYWEIQQKINNIANRIEEINSIIAQKKITGIFYIIINNFTSWYKYDPSKLKNISYLILNYDDLFFISNINDLDELSLYKYSITEKNAITPELVGWSFIDKFAFYLDHGYSFYSSDERRDTVYLWPGYGHDLRKMVFAKTDHHLMISTEPNNFIPVKRLYSEEITLPIYVPQNSNERSSIGVEIINQTFWIIPNPSQKERNVGVTLFNTFSEMIASWICEIQPYISQKISNRASNHPIIIEYYIDQIDTWQGNLVECEIETIEIEDFNFEIQEYRISLKIPLKLRPYLFKNTNEGERLFLHFFLDALTGFLDTFSDDRSIQKNNQKVVDEFAPYGHKKYFHLINTAYNPFIDISGIIPPRLLDEACYQIELDNLGLLFKFPDPIAKTVLEERSVNKKLHGIVDIFHNLIKNQISQFAFDSIFPYTISQYESILVYRHLYQYTFSAKLHINPINRQTTANEAKNYKLMDRTSHAVRTLIEIISAEPPKGNRIFNKFEYDAIIAKIILLLEFAFFSDVIKLKLGSVDLSLLESGRIGMISDYTTKWEFFYNEKVSEHISNTLMGRHSKKPEAEQPEIEQYIIDLDEAFLVEYGYSFSDLFDFTIALYQLVNDDNSFRIVALEEFIHLISDITQLSESTVHSLIENLSLKNREKWENPPEGFTHQDIFPWIFNRRLSYLIRPLVINRKDNGDISIIWGKTQALYTSKHIIDLILTGRYQKFVRSEKLKTLIGKIRNEGPHQFVINASSLLTTIDEFIVDTEIPIKPGKVFSSETDIGDIDILAIDSRNSIIYIIECKDMNFSRTPREIATELEEFTDPEHNNYLNKHQKRVDWINQNISVVIQYYSIPEKRYQIAPLIITSEEIPAPFFENVKIPFLSFTSVRRLFKNTDYPNKADGFKQMYKKILH